MPPPSASPIATSFFKSLSHHPPPPLLHHHHHGHRTFIRRHHTTKELNSFRCLIAKPACWRMGVVHPRQRCRPFDVGERRWKVDGGGGSGGGGGGEGVGGSDERRRRRREELARYRVTVDSVHDGRRRDADGEEAEVEIGNGREPVARSRLMTIPTVLTLGRVAAVPLLVSTFYLDTWWSATATTSIFLVAAITDWLDGYIARKMHLGTAFGAFLDPVADKLMVAATLVVLCTRPLESSTFGQAPWILTVPSIAIIGREITMSAVREWAASQDSKVLEAVAVNNLGKWKTATQMTALTILLATRDGSFKGPDGLVASGVVLLYISAGLAVWSLAVYMKKIWRLMLK